MLGAAVLCLVASALAAQGVVRGRVTDGRGPVAGAGVAFDWGLRVGGPSRASAVTDEEGRFALERPEGAPARLVVEKAGFITDVVPEARWGSDLRLRAASSLKAPVLVVRVAFPDRPSAVPDAVLRELFFGRAPGQASAAAYLARASKGRLGVEEAGWLDLQCPFPLGDEPDEARFQVARWVMKQLRGRDLRPFDRLDNRTGAPKPDGKPDQLWIVLPGWPRTVTNRDADFRPTSLRPRLPWNRARRWSMVLVPEEVVLGHLVHEVLHTMGEHRVDDFYLDCGDPRTAGIWDVMDVGMYRGWDRYHPDAAPWREDTAYSPSLPMGWTRAVLWYHGAFKDTVPALRIVKGDWEGWLDPLERAPGEHPQRLLVPDRRRKGRFFELSVRRPWSYDGGSIGPGPASGREGLVVARIDPSRLTYGDPKGPVRVVDAHPGTPEPPKPHLSCDRHDLDDAAFRLGPGEVAAGRDGALSWEVLEEDGAGRMRVRIRIR